MPLEALLLTWIDNLIPITKIFPQFYSNKKNLAELLIITKSFIDCGKGSLQHKNKIFYYRTYLQSRDDDSNSNEIITSSSVLNIKKVFLLFLCDVNYKKKDIDTLTKQIYEILDQGAFDSKDLKVDSSRKLNFLFEQYRNNTENISLLIPLNDIKGSNDDLKESLIENNINNNNIINTNINNNIINSSEDSFNIDDTLKRASSRIIWSKVNKNKSSPLGSIDINDLTSIKGSETDLSIMLKQGSDENISFSKMKKMKSIKKINIVLCIILFVISLVLIILLFLYK